MSIKYSNAYPPMFNIPNRDFSSEADKLAFHALTACEENPGYKLAKTMRPLSPAIIPVAPSHVAESRWDEPCHRTLPSGARVKIVHNFKTGNCEPLDAFFEEKKVVKEPIPIHQSCVVDGRDAWEDPSYRTLRNGGQVKIVHAFKADGFVPEQPDTRVPQKIRSTPEVVGPLHASENVIQLRPSERCPKGLKRVKTINRRAGKAIRERRNEDKENLAAAKFYVDALY